MSKAEDSVTLELYFELIFPGWQAPEDRYRRSWINSADGDLSKVIEALDHIAERARRGKIESPEHASKLCTMMLRYPNLREVRTIHN